MTTFRATASSGTRLPPFGLDPSTPAGQAKTLAIGAGECLKGAMDLEQGFPDLTGEYILTFHAIELGLKAFLVSRGVAPRPFGHNLVKLYEAATQQGLSIGIPDVDEMLAWINEWHCDGVKIRYEFTTPRHLPMCGTLFSLAEAIISVTGKVPNAATVGATPRAEEIP
jgi:hypothetical protein